jgi:hypothetical protein
VLNRAETEAALRRNLTEACVPGIFHDAVVGAFLAEMLPSASQPVHLITASFALACGHDGHDPGSYLASEVTCGDCLKSRTP